MGRRSGRPEGTFYFQAWHVDKALGGESWSDNKEMADYVDQNLSPESKRWLCVRACIPTKSTASLAIPYSICVKRRAPKRCQEDESEKYLLQFRNKEYPSIAKRYFLTRLRKTLDFFNAYADGVSPGSPLANFSEVKSSKQLSQRVQAVIRHVKRESWGDLADGLLEGGPGGCEFKATKFIVKRGQDLTRQNPHVLSTAPLQTILLSSHGSPHVSDVSFSSQESSHYMDDASSVSSANSDDTSATLVSDESADGGEAAEPCSAEESTEESFAVESSSAPEMEETRSSTSICDQAVVRKSSAQAVVVRQQQMAYMMSGHSQMAFVNVQSPRKLLQSMMASTTASFNLPKGMKLFDAPMVFAMAGSPIQSLQADGTMRLFFLSKTKKRKTTTSGPKKKSTDDLKDEEEWVVGSVKLSTRPRGMKMLKGTGSGSVSPTKSFLPPMPEDAPREKEEEAKTRVVEIEEEDAVKVAHEDTCSPDCFSTHCRRPPRKRTLIEQDKRILHMESKTITRVVEVEEVDVNEKKAKKGRAKPRRSSPSSRRTSTTTKKRKTISTTTTTTTSSTTTEAKELESTPPAPRKPKAPPKYDFHRESWRSEPQPPELFCDVVNGSNFLHVEDLEVFSFSAMTRETLQRYGGEDADGINVWAPPSMKVVGVLSWMWDHFNVNPWAKAAS